MCCVSPGTAAAVICYEKRKAESCFLGPGARAGGTAAASVNLARLGDEGGCSKGVGCVPIRHSVS